MSVRWVCSAVVAVCLIASAFSFATMCARAEEGDADVAGYHWTDNISPDPVVSYNWIEVVATGEDTGIAGDDEYGGPFPIGFSFEFYENTYTEFYATSNGLVTFGSGSGDSANGYIPAISSPNNFIAPYWDDLGVSYSGYNSGHVYYDTVGVAPARQLVVEWHEVSERSSYDLMTFEVILNETGEIWMQYETLSGRTGDWATVGIENSDGMIGSQYSCDSAVLSDGLAIMFQKSPFGFGPAQTQVADAGSTAYFALHLTNNQVIADSFDITTASMNGWPVTLHDSTWNPLGDSNGNTVPDTGTVLPDGVATIYVGVEVPSSPTSPYDVVIVSAQSREDPSVQTEVLLRVDVTPAELTPPHSDCGVDDDSDMTYDRLVVDVVLEVVIEDSYFIYGDLYDSSWDHIISAPMLLEHLPQGAHTVPLSYDGEAINGHNVNGPYYAEFSVHSSTYYWSTDGSHTTAAYLWSEFDSPQAKFSPPHDDMGLDTDSDGLYNGLVVLATVEINTAGTYTVSAVLRDSSADTITVTENGTYLGVGTHIVWLFFDGGAIVGLRSDGPYTVEMSLRDDSWNHYENGEHTTAAYTWDEFQKIACFSPPHSDYGLDSDGDDLYDYLVVSASVTVTVEGWYEVYAELHASGMPVDDTDSGAYLGLGTSSVELQFTGHVIRSRGLDGPYLVEMWLYDDREDLHDLDSHTTEVYLATEFETPPGALAPPYSDYGRDDDGDGLYDYLVVEIPVEIFEEGDYCLNADLYASGGWPYIDGYTECFSATPGTTVIEVEYFAWDIQYSGQDGPYSVELDLYDASWNILGDDSHTTDAYTLDMFEERPAELSPPHADYGVDLDADLLYDYLVVEVAVDVAVADTYVVEGSLYDSAWWHSCDAENTTYLDVGLQTVGLSFPGWVITAWGLVGPYHVELALFDADYNDMDWDWHDMGEYYLSDFNTTVPGFDSSWTNAAASIDGVMSPDEWAVATAVDLLVADRVNDLAATMYVMNNGTHLFICYDVVGDTTSSSDDSAAVSFDTDNDDAPTDGHDDQFSVGGLAWIPGSQLHAVYDEVADDWVEHCAPFDETEPDHSGLASARGFGTSPASATPHRIFELAIPLGLLGALPGDSLGFAGLSEQSAGVWDDSEDSYSTWPAHVNESHGGPPLAFYGDLRVAVEPVATAASLTGTAGLSGWFLADVTVTLTASGGEGGVDYTMYRVNADTWQDYAAPFVVSGDGEHTVEFYSVDLGGNSEPTWSVAVRIDTVEPETEATASGTTGENGWYTAEVTVVLSAEDGSGGSGMSAIRYRTDDSSWSTYSDPIVLDVDGVHVLEYLAVDIAGLSEDVQSLTVKVDSTAPTSVAAVDESTVTLTASDEASGLNRTMYRIDDGEWALYDGAFEVEDSGNHTVEFYSVDNAGNTETTLLTYVDNGGGGGTLFGVDWWAIILVLLILALLVTIAVPKLFGMRKKAKESDARAARKDIGTAVAQLQDDYRPTRTQDMLKPEEEAPPREK